MTTPDPIRAALEALVEHIDALSGTYGHRLGCDCGGTPDGTHSCGSFRSAIAAVRAALAAPPPAPDEALRARIEKVLSDHGIVPNENGFHAWRCEHPDRYPGYCHCVPDLINDLLALAAQPPAPPTPDEALRMVAMTRALVGCRRLWSVVGPRDSGYQTLVAKEVLAEFDRYLALAAQPPTLPAPMEGITPEEWDAFEAATGTVERCGYQMFVGRLCGGTPDAPLHDAHHVDYHPYRPTPPATEERGWAASCYCNAEYPGCTDPACTCSHHAPPATGPVVVGTMTEEEGRAFIEAATGTAPPETDTTPHASSVPHATGAVERECVCSVRADDCGLPCPCWHHTPAPAPSPSARVAEVRRQQSAGGGPVTAVRVSRSDDAPSPSAALVEAREWLTDYVVAATLGQIDVTEVSRRLDRLLAAARAEAGVSLEEMGKAWAAVEAALPEHRYFKVEHDSDDDPSWYLAVWRSDGIFPDPIRWAQADTLLDGLTRLALELRTPR